MRQCILHRVSRLLVHRAPVAKAHLDLGRVDVDIDQGSGDLNEEHIAGLAVAVQHVFIRAADAVGNQFVAHEAAVDVDVLHIGPAARSFRQTGAAVEAQRPGFSEDGAAFGHELGTQHIAQALFGRRGAPLLDQLALMPDGEADIRPHQRMAAHGFQAMRQFGGVGLQELAAGGRAEEELAHLDAGAARAGRCAQLAAAGIQTPGMRRTLDPAGHAHLGHRCNRGQRLAAKAHGHDRFQLMQRADLAGRMAFQGQRQFVQRYAAAIVLDHDAAHATGHQLDLHLGRPGVQRVVHQFAHDGRRPLYHLACGDLADQFIGKFLNDAARRRCTETRLQGKGQIHGSIVRSPVTVRSQSRRKPPA